MSTTFSPTNPIGFTPEQQAWLNSEFRALKRALESSFSLDIRDYLHIQPERTLAGMVVLADGSDWNPGSGAGAYRRNEANTAWMPIGGLVAGTAVATTSGTSIDFTGIPAGVKRITFNFVGVSTNGTDGLLVQLGDSGGIETSGYLSAFCVASGGAVSQANSTSGFNMGVGSAAALMNGSLILTLQDGTTWTAQGSIGNSAAASMSWTSGSKALSATLDRLRLTTSGGVNTFDAGSVNILYE